MAGSGFTSLGSLSFCRSESGLITASRVPALWSSKVVQGPGAQAELMWLHVGELVPSPASRQEVIPPSGTQAETDSEAEALGGCFCTSGAGFFLQGPQGTV